MKSVKIMFVLFLLILMNGCTSEIKESSFDEAMLLAYAEASVKRMMEGDADFIVADIEEKIRLTVDEEQLKAVVIGEHEKAENFVEFVRHRFSEGEHPLEKYPIGIVEMIGKYENGAITYVFQFNTDNKLIGFNLVFRPSTGN